MIEKPSKLQLMNKKARRDEIHETSPTQNSLIYQDWTKELAHHSKAGLVEKKDSKDCKQKSQYKLTFDHLHTHVHKKTKGKYGNHGWNDQSANMSIKNIWRYKTTNPKHCMQRLVTKHS